MNTALGLANALPGLNVFATVIQAGLQEVARANDLEFWAKLERRVDALNEQIRARFRPDDPEFVAAAHRLFRASQETADEEKRELLAAALAFSGSWSDLPPDDRHRMERLVIELSSREVYLLKILADPRGWLMDHDPSAVMNFEQGFGGSVWDLLNTHVSRGDLGERSAVRSAYESLNNRGLADIPPGMMTGAGALQSRATGLGHEFVNYLRAIES